MPGGTARSQSPRTTPLPGARPLPGPASQDPHPVPRHCGAGAARGDGAGPHRHGSARPSCDRPWQALSFWPRPMSWPGGTRAWASQNQYRGCCRAPPARCQQGSLASNASTNRPNSTITFCVASVTARPQRRRLTAHDGRGPPPSLARWACHQPNRRSYLHHEMKGPVIRPPAASQKPTDASGRAHNRGICHIRRD
jgi:hypothetical protein